MEQEVPKGYAEVVEKELRKIAPHLLKELDDADYCGFEIYKFDGNFIINDKGYKIRNKVFNLELINLYAIHIGICDTFEYAKYFVDQILYRDLEFKNMLRELIIEKEWSDKKTIVSLYLKNI